MIDSWVSATDFPHERVRRGAAARGAMVQFQLNRAAAGWHTKWINISAPFISISKELRVVLAKQQILLSVM